MADICKSLRSMPSSLNDACRTMEAAAGQIDALVKALREIISANNDFRKGMPETWDGDPLQDAVDGAAKLLLRLGGQHD